MTRNSEKEPREEIIGKLKKRTDFGIDNRRVKTECADPGPGLLRCNKLVIMTSSTNND